MSEVVTVKVTRHCIKRVVERALVYGFKEALKLIDEILKNGYIVRRRKNFVLVNFRNHYLLLRECRNGYLALTYLAKVEPRGFNGKVYREKFPKYRIVLSRRAKRRIKHICGEK
ncbi:MAG TPA: hypothetical protein ENF53_00775 [Thermoprotei archaeon]|nr:hypothetical protein [Thermoprotei archaeon]